MRLELQIGEPLHLHSSCTASKLRCSSLLIITELQPKAAHILMTILLHLGYLMTPEQRRMITNVQRSTSGEFDVIASISTQPKQRSENRRVLSPAMSMGPL
jgi:hypothetical protein